MENKKVGYVSIDEYIANFPKDVQAVLEKLRATIKKAAPNAEETINYQIPTFTLKGEFGAFCRIQKAHWVLSNAIRDGEIQKGTVWLRGVKRFGAISAG